MSKLDLRGLFLSFLLLNFNILARSALFVLWFIACSGLVSILSKLIRMAGTLLGFLADKALVTSPSLNVGAVGTRL